MNSRFNLNRSLHSKIIARGLSMNETGNCMKYCNRKAMETFGSPKYTQSPLNYRNSTPLKDSWHQKTLLFTNNNENLISSIIKERAKGILFSNDKDNDKDSSLSDFNGLNNDIIISTNIKHKKEPCISNNPIDQSKNQMSHVVSLNQNFVNHLNIEIEKYKRGEVCGSSSTRASKRIAPYSSRHSDRPTSAAPFFATNLPLFSSNSHQSTCPQEERKLIHYQKKKKYQVKRMPFIIQCMNKKKKKEEPNDNNMYFQEGFNAYYSNRYRKLHANVEDILLFHNTFERTGFGKYLMPSTIKSKLNNRALKPQLDADSADHKNKRFGVKWDSIRISKIF